MTTMRGCPPQKLFLGFFASLTSLLLILIFTASASAYAIYTANYINNANQKITVFYESPFSIAGGSIYVYMYNSTDFSTELLDGYSGSSLGYISGNGTIQIPFFSTISWNTNSSKNNSNGAYDEYMVELRNETNVVLDIGTFQISAPIPPTPTPTPNPTPTSPMQNQNISSTFTANTSGATGFQTYANTTIANVSGTISSAFGLVSNPMINFSNGIQQMNSSLNNFSYNMSMSILIQILPAITAALPAKVKALVSFYLVLIVVIIILGRE